MTKCKPVKSIKVVFLDKDIVFRFGRLKVFKEGMLRKQREIIRLIQDGKIKAFISNNTPFAVINHLTYKYTRSDRARDEEGLREEAESKTGEWFDTIFGKGKWELINIQLADYKDATEDEKLDWEDAVQYQCARKVKNRPFITENLRHFEKTDLDVYSPRNLNFE